MRYSKSYRVLRLYTWLEQRKTISLSGTAADFGIDERTVQRDIADIEHFWQILILKPEKEEQSAITGKKTAM